MRTGVRLPKLVLKTFDGDALEWKPFFDSFDAAVNIKEDLTNIEKFTYLRSFLSGKALQSIDGFPLSTENYVEVLNVLKERCTQTCSTKLWRTSDGLEG